MIEKNKNKQINMKKRGDLIFFWSLLAWPLAFLAVFYFYVNINSFVLMFQRYDVDTRTYYFGDIFYNFKRFFSEFSASNEIPMGLLRGAIGYIYSLIISTPITLYFSFVIYKKVPCHKFFKIMLYAPSVISSTVWVLLYTQSMDTLVPEVYKMLTGESMKGLLSNPKTSFIILLYFGTWSSAGGGTLLYISSMSAIPEEQVEAMAMDGAGKLREFVHLIIPHIWPIYSLFLFTGISSLITNDLNLYTFFEAGSAPENLRTFGYWLMVRKVRASQNVFDLPYIAAIGLFQSAICIPIMFITKKLCEKFGPSED